MRVVVFLGKCHCRSHRRSRSFSARLDLTRCRAPAPLQYHPLPRPLVRSAILPHRGRRWSRLSLGGHRWFWAPYCRGRHWSPPSSRGVRKKDPRGIMIFLSQHCIAVTHTSSVRQSAAEISRFPASEFAKSRGGIHQQVSVSRKTQSRGQSASRKVALS